VDLVCHGGTTRWALAASEFCGSDRWLLLVHLFTFDLHGFAEECHRSEWVFYDGNCALCHGWVRFVLAEDTDERPFGFHRCKESCLQRASRQKNAPHSLTVSHTYRR